MGERFQLGARLKGLSVVAGDESCVIATYDLITPENVAIGGGGAIRIEFAAIDAIDRHAGGTGCPSDEQRLDIAAKFLRPLFVASFERIGSAPERQDVTVHAQGAVTSARPSKPPQGA